MKKQFIFYALLSLIISCKSDKQDKKNNVDGLEQKQIISQDIKTIKEGLYNYWEADAPNGSKILVNKDKIYYIKENPTKIDTTIRYFLHVKLKNGELLNMDFNYKDYVLQAKNQSEYKNFAIAYRELTLEPIFSILTGQFDENGRLWQIVLHEQNFY